MNLVIIWLFGMLVYISAAVFGFLSTKLALRKVFKRYGQDFSKVEKLYVIKSWWLIGWTIVWPLAFLAAVFGFHGHLVFTTERRFAAAQKPMSGREGAEKHNNPQLSEAEVQANMDLLGG